MILAVLQARLSSTRLPGKVLKPILGLPMLFLQIERIARCSEIDKLLVATSDEDSDDQLAMECISRGISVYRGSLLDVLSRFSSAAREYNPAAVVRLTGDCPLADWEVIDSAVRGFRSGNYEYLANVEPATYPDGLDVEVVAYGALLEAEREAVLPSEREHVTLFIRKHRERYRIGSLIQDTDLSALRWTVDDLEDFELVRRIYEALYPGNPAFKTADILALLKRQPGLTGINRKVERNLGLKNSLSTDDAWLSRRNS